MTDQTLPRFSADNGLRFRTMGDSGLFVSELCLGTMTFGGDEDIWGLIGQVQQEQADELMKIALEAGINFIDTANIYGHGVRRTSRTRRLVVKEWAARWLQTPN